MSWVVQMKEANKNGPQKQHKGSLGENNRGSQCWDYMYTFLSLRSKTLFPSLNSECRFFNNKYSKNIL